jgi:phosphomannomutase/phosphoglucomutase
MSIFKAYDIRGVYGKDLTDEITEKVGKSFGTFLGGNKKIFVGRDMRTCSVNLSNNIIKGLISTGCEVTDIGMVATPMLYFSIIHYKKDGGCMITASHNPSEWGGIKLRIKNALGVSSGEGMEDIENMVKNNKFIHEKIGKVVKKNIEKEYVNIMSNKIKIQKKIKIIVDSGNGMGGISERIFKNVGCNVKTIFSKPDGKFPNHIPDPWQKYTLESLRKKVIQEKADLGISFDGDADRVGFVDNKGRVIENNDVFMIFINNVLKENPKSKIIFDVRYSRMINDAIEKMNGKPVLERVGNPFLMKRRYKTNAPLAGELTGHYWFKEWYGIDDGIFAGAKMIEIASKIDSISKVVDSLPKDFIIKDSRLPCPDEKKFIVIENLKKKIIKQGYKIITIDGLKIITDEWSVLIRPSNTQPEITVTTESRKRKLEEYHEKFKELLINEIKIS